MTVSFNLSQLANYVNSSGQLDASTGLVNAATVANGGTGRSSQTAYALIAGGTTSTGPQQSLAGVGTAGQLLVSNGAGALPSFQTVTLSGIPLMDVKTSGSGTWTIPSGVTRVRITVVGGGGNGGGGGGQGGSGGGGGGTAIKVLSVVAGTLSYSVGAATASSTVSSGTNNTISTITGGGGSTGNTGDGFLLGGAGGTASNGDLNMTGANGGSSTEGNGGNSYLGSGGPTGSNVSSAGRAYGGGGASNNGVSSRAGASGVIIFEY